MSSSTEDVVSLLGRFRVPFSTEITWEMILGGFEIIKASADEGHDELATLEEVLSSYVSDFLSKDT